MLGHDLGAVHVLAVLVLPFTGADAAFDLAEGAFLEVFAGDSAVEYCLGRADA
jgi:hypothetical protein